MIIAKSITQSEKSQVSHARLHSKLPDRPKCRAPGVEGPLEGTPLGV